MISAWTSGPVIFSAMRAKLICSGSYLPFYSQHFIYSDFKNDLDWLLWIAVSAGQFAASGNVTSFRTIVKLQATTFTWFSKTFHGILIALMVAANRLLAVLRVQPAWEFLEFLRNRLNEATLDNIFPQNWSLTGKSFFRRRYRFSYMCWNFPILLLPSFASYGLVHILILDSDYIFSQKLAPMHLRLFILIALFSRSS